jgi:beta-glucanase (GH16 family)
MCKSGSYTPRAANMVEQIKYLGNTTDIDFVYTGSVEDDDDSVRIKMNKNSGGSVISSTFYIWYGKASFKYKTSHNAGVISAGILFSQVQDEIDFEFVGSQLTIAESNFYFEGIPSYTNSLNLNTSDTYEDWHTYEIDWTEDSITWSIDGNAMRTLNKEDTLNTTSNMYEFPQTPSRIQFSIWPGGASSNAPGTIEWSGGPIDWNAPDFQDPGYLFSALDTVEIECYDPPSSAQTQGKADVSYIYDGKGFMENNVILSDKQTWMKNLGNTGFYTGQEDVEESNSSSSAHTSSTKSSTSSSSSSSTKHSSSLSSSTSSSSSSSSTSSSTPVHSSAPQTESTTEEPTSTTAQPTHSVGADPETTVAATSPAPEATTTTSGDNGGFVQYISTSSSSSAQSSASVTVSEHKNVANKSQSTIISIIFSISCSLFL